MIIIVDYKMGNLGSILNMLKKIGAPAMASSLPEDILQADKLILPGVGAFDNGMTNLKESGLLSVLNEKVLAKKTPILGICLGMQLLTRRSAEGRLEGLGWIEADTIRFRFGREESALKIPHMGWNTVMFKPGSVLSSELEDEARFYFVHSFHVVCDREENVAGKTFYGYEFSSAIQNGNIMGVQFHPEKSHKYGLRLLKNFVEM